MLNMPIFEARLISMRRPTYVMSAILPLHIIWDTLQLSIHSYCSSCCSQWYS